MFIVYSIIKRSNKVLVKCKKLLDDKNYFLHNKKEIDKADVVSMIKTLKSIVTIYIRHLEEAIDVYSTILADMEDCDFCSIEVKNI